MINTPDYDLAAIKAMELLVEHNITETPVNPLPILLNYPRVRVMPFTQMADATGIDRHDLIPLFGGNQDAATFHLTMPDMDEVYYVVIYNMRLPFEMIWRGIARELGHVVLGHTGTQRSTGARRDEAMCFAHHLLCPRPVIRMIQDSGTPLTMSVLAHTTGCSDECVEDIQKIPGVHVPKELNRQVKDLFARGIHEYIRFHAASPIEDHSPIIDIGTYMDYYEE